jgi:GTP-binding protein Era
MERLFDHKVVLKLWVKVKANWSDDARAMKSLGFNDAD